MNFEPTRKRREIAPFTVNFLRMAGWRFSFTRAAWVHRIGRGRYGPVFVVRDGASRYAGPSNPTGFAVVSVAESAVAEAEAAVSAAAAAARAAEPPAPLPQRPPRTPVSPAVAPAEPAIELTEVRPAPRDEPLTTEHDPEGTSNGWKVDGRPTQPRPRLTPNELHSVQGTANRASA